MRRSNWPPNCTVPLQIAQVQVFTELLEAHGFWTGSGFEGPDSFPKTVLPFKLVCLRNLHAVAPKPQGRLRPLRRRAQAIILFFIN